MQNENHNQIDTLIDDGPEGVLREGKIFEAGDYPERTFTLTVPELEEAAANFQPLPLKLQHVDTPLDGKLGVLESLHVAGSALIGRARLPKWLDRLIPDKRVSCGWDRATKRLAELSLVTEPRIADAVLYAVGAQDRQLNPEETTRVILPDFDQLKETTNPMNFKDWLAKMRALFSILPPDEPGDDDPQVLGGETNPLRAQLEALKARQRQVEAASFADGEIRARRAYPAERAPLIAAFTLATEDDDRFQDIARFEGDEAASRVETPASRVETPASRVETLKSLLAARTPHPLTDELLDPSRVAKALFHEQKTGSEVSADARRAELLSQTHMGREILRTEKGK